MLRVIAVICVAAAAAAPAALARHSPDDYAPRRSVVPTSSVRDELDARLGPKCVFAAATICSPRRRQP